MRNRFPQIVVGFSAAILFSLFFLRGQVDDVKSFVSLSSHLTGDDQMKLVLSVR